MNIEYIRAIQNAKGSNSKKETLIEYNKRRIARSYEENLENLNLLRYPTKDDYVSISVHHQKQEDWGWYLQSTALLSSDLCNGDTFYDEEYKDYFIVKNLQRTKHFYDLDLVACNYMLRWQNDDRIICEQPCVVISASQYNSGERSNKVMTLGTNQIMIRMQITDETLILKSDKRFFIDYDKSNPKVYRLTRIDTVTRAWNGRGYLEIVFTEDTFNADTDSIEHFICDYLPEADKDINISYRGSPEIRISGVKTFTSNVPVSWSIDKDYISIISMDDKILKIKCNEDVAIGDTFNVFADNVSINMKVVGLL